MNNITYKNQKIASKSKGIKKTRNHENNYSTYLERPLNAIENLNNFREIQIGKSNIATNSSKFKVRDKNIVSQPFKDGNLKSKCINAVDITKVFIK